MADAMVTELLRRRPESPAESLGVDVAANTPAPLFQWLVTSLLVSAPISSALAMKAAHALIDAGLTTPEKMREVLPLWLAQTVGGTLWNLMLWLLGDPSPKPPGIYRFGPICR